jgi:hypothetical protein
MRTAACDLYRDAKTLFRAICRFSWVGLTISHWNPLRRNLHLDGEFWDLQRDQAGQ